jgi:serpin B
MVIGMLPCRSVSINALPPAVARAKSAHTPVDAALVAANNDFGFRLFSELSKRESSRNLFTSPSSIALALDMVYNGARGETQQGMAKALGIGKMTAETLNAGNAALLASLSEQDPGIQLSIANSLWIQPSMLVNPAFIEVNKDVYGAEVAPLVSIDAVNNWVSKQTHEKIKSILSPGDEKSQVILVNAIYFKGPWTHRFKTEDTKEAPFTLNDGRTKSVKMMHQTGMYAYFKGEGFQAVRLPYATGRLRMDILLPDKDTDYRSLVNKLTEGNWQRWSTRFAATQGDIGLPNFKADYEAELLPELKAMGMNGTDFGDIATRLVIHRVKHKTILEVSEEGTEAAAVTSVQMKRSAVIRPPAEKFNMIVDHPFICAIEDGKTGAILFLGSIVEPM